MLRTIGKGLLVFLLVTIVLAAGTLIAWLLMPLPRTLQGAHFRELIRGETVHRRIRAYAEAVVRDDTEAALAAWRAADTDRACEQSRALAERRREVTEALIAADLAPDYTITDVEWWRTCCEPGVICSARGAGGARVHVQFLDGEGLPVSYVFDVFHQEGAYFGAAAGYPPRQWALVDVYPRGEPPLYWRFVYTPTVQYLSWPSEPEPIAP